MALWNAVLAEYAIEDVAGCRKRARNASEAISSIRARIGERSQCSKRAERFS
jgi:hypothetical protein